MQARALPVQPCYDVVVFLLLQPNAVSDVWDVCAGAQDAIEAQRFLQAPGGEARQRRLRDALHVAADVAEALRFLHSLDVVHGRLTPSARRAWSQPPLDAAAVFGRRHGWSTCARSARLRAAAWRCLLLPVHGRIAPVLTISSCREGLRASYSAPAERVRRLGCCQLVSAVLAEEDQAPAADA